MKGLVHGGDCYGYPNLLADFSVNTNPLGLPELVGRALRSSPDCWERYPDPLCRKLRDRIAMHDHVESGWVHCGNGAADLLYRVAQAVQPRRALLLVPGFAEYEYALEAAGCRMDFYPLRETDGFHLTKQVLKALHPQLDLVILCNPNNPTGLPVAPELLLDILRRCAENQCFLLVDECFLAFLPAGQDLLRERLAGFPNLLLLRAFTKLYAMAGLRLGYLLSANRNLLDRIQACEPPWNVSGPAQIAGIAALESAPDYLARTRMLVDSERVFLENGLKTLGMKVYGSQANYLFFRAANRFDLREKLLEQGYLIRSCANYRELDGRFYRIAVRTHQENTGLLRAMREVLAAE